MSNLQCSAGRNERVAISVVVGLVFFWAYISGKDVNWDLINYHFYGAYQFLEGRVHQDFLAAGIQSYINPIGYLPFYWLVMSGIPSLAVAGVLTLIHVGSLLLLWRLSFRLFPGMNGENQALRVLGVALAAASPVFLTTVGTSFLDPVSALLVIGALYLVSVNECRWRILLGSGFMGAAVGFKLTNVFFLPAFFVFLLIVLGRAVWGWKNLLQGAVGVLVGGGLLHGYWSVLLWREFGNPIFPFANNVFHSPDFPPVALHDARFQLAGFSELLLLPLRMVEAKSGVYTENLSPDLRILPLFIGLGVLTLFFRQFASQGGCRWFLALAGFWLVGFFAWLFGSTIGRYALPLWMLAGILLPFTVARLMPARWAVTAMAILLCAQLIHGFISVGNYRWQPTAWEGSWVEVNVPSELQRKKAFYLSVGVQTYSIVIPYFSSDSVFSNIIGQYTLPYGAAMPPRLQRMIRDWDGDFYVLGAVIQNYDAVLPKRIRDDFSALLAPYGFSLVDRPCEKVRLKGAGVVPWAGSSLLNPQKSAYFDIFACRLYKNPPGPDKVWEIERVNRVFDVLERLCPQRLGPQATTIQGRAGWQRLYFKQQSALILKDGVVFYRPYLSMSDKVVGSFSNLERGGELDSGWCN